MNAKTTATAARFAIASNGVKFELPAFFPTSEDRLHLRNHLVEAPSDALIRLIQNMDDVLKNGDSVNTDELAMIWDKAEQEFVQAIGFGWNKIVAIRKADSDPEFYHKTEARIQQDNAAREKQEAKAQATAFKVPGLDIEDAHILHAHIENNPFQMVNRDAYSRAFLGACSTRRAGITWTVWSERMIVAGMNRSLVAYIVLRAYSMPSSELVVTSR